MVGLDPLGHELKVGVVLLPQLLQEAGVLLLHVLEGLPGHLHLGKEGLFLLLVVGDLGKIYRLPIYIPV